MKPEKIIAMLAIPTLILLAGIAVRMLAGASLMDDINGIGWFVGVIGTFYTLVAAFSLVEVWSKFNNVSGLLAKESKNLSSLWDYTDYLNDRNIDEKMKNALISYANSVKSETESLSKGKHVKHMSKELVEIQNTIDSIKFDDARDSSVFPLIMSEYESLSSTRADRIDTSSARLPSMVRMLLILLSTILIAGFSLLGFVHTALFSVSLFSLALLVTYFYELITDLDKPFEGEWSVSIDVLDDAIEYIKSEVHENSK